MNTTPVQIGRDAQIREQVTLRLADIAKLACDAVLFGLEEVERDGVGIVGAKKLGAFGEQPLPLRVEVASLVLGCFAV